MRRAAPSAPDGTPAPGARTAGGRVAPRIETTVHQLAVRDRQIEAVHTVTQLLFAKLRLDERLRDVLTASMRAVDATAGSIYLHRAADNSLVFQYVVGPADPAALIGKAMPVSQGIAGRVFLTGKTVADNNPRASVEHRGDIGEAVGFVTESLVTVPLKTLEGDPVGVMQILNKQGGGFDEDDIEVLEIVAAIAATAIENAELQREAQMAAVARAVGNLSHDIKNKVAPVAMVADILGPDLKTMFSDLDAVTERLDPELRDAVSDATALVREEYAEHCEILRDQVRAVQEHTKLISDALKGIETTPQLEPCDLNAIVRDQVHELVPVARERGVAIVTDLAEAPSIACDRYLIRSAVFNLLNNAIPETPPGGTISVRMKVTEAGVFPAGHCVCVEVADTGNGMPPHVLERLLRGEANSTKPGGSGLGTKIVYNAARAHGGVLEGESAEGIGTTIRVKLPLTSCDAVHPPKA